MKFIFKPASSFSHYQRNPVENPISTCSECGEVIPSPQLGDHLVDNHGYRRDGRMVFKRKFCEVCGKPAIYKEGARTFCSTHKNYAKVASVKNTIKRDKRQSDVSFDVNEQEKILRDRDQKARLNRAKKIRGKI